MKKEVFISCLIKENRNRLSEVVIESMFSRNAKLKEKYHKFYERLVSDVQFHYDYLAESILYSSESLLIDYCRWLVVFFRDINVTIEEIQTTFRLMEEEFNKILDDDAKQLAGRYFTVLYNNLSSQQSYQIPSFIETDNPFAETTREYFSLLLSHKRRDAAKLLTALLENGSITIKEIYIYVFQRSQWEIGRLWQTGKLSVAEEHTFTAATQLIMSQLYPYLFSKPKYKGKAIAACVGRELHEIGIRMIADFMEMDGWDTIYIGANTPTNTLIKTIETEKPDVLALSTTIMPHLKNMRDTISKIKEHPSLNHLKVIVGGYPFNRDKNLWKQMHADGFAADADEALRLINKLAV